MVFIVQYESYDLRTTHIKGIFDKYDEALLCLNMSIQTDIDILNHNADDDDKINIDDYKEVDISEYNIFNMNGYTITKIKLNICTSPKLVYLKKMF